MTERPRLWCQHCPHGAGAPTEPRDGDLVLADGRAYLHPATPLPCAERAVGTRVVTLSRAVTDAYVDVHDTLRDVVAACFVHFVELEISLRVTDPWVASLCPWPIDTRWQGAVVRVADCQPPTLRLVFETNRSAPLSLTIGVGDAAQRGADLPARFYADAKTTRGALVLHHADETPMHAIAAHLTAYGWRRYHAYGLPARAADLSLVTIYIGAAAHRDAAARAVRAALHDRRFVLDAPPVDRTVERRGDGSWQLAWLLHAEHRWPHTAAYLRDVTLALSATGLSTWPLLWLLDWLPGMLQWREIAKMRTIDRTLASVRRVREARSKPAAAEQAAAARL